MNDEIRLLRRRISNQRAELKRLNKMLEWYWAGVRRGYEISDVCVLRGKMIKAFGVAAVQNAERNA